MPTVNYPRERLNLSCYLFPARSSSGLGRRPLKAEITGSNPVRATIKGNFCFPFFIKINKVIYTPHLKGVCFEQ